MTIKELIRRLTLVEDHSLEVVITEFNSVEFHEIELVAATVDEIEDRAVIALYIDRNK